MHTRKQQRAAAETSRPKPTRNYHHSYHLQKLNFLPQLREAPPFATKQFHVLLNSLFKVLFNFPSRYLFAIGLGVIFSLMRSLPQTLGCTSKQPDSMSSRQPASNRANGTHTLYGAPVKRTLRVTSQHWMKGLNTTSRQERCPQQLGAGLIPVHSPLLRKSQLFSFPPLINMLKFGGSSWLTSGQKVKFLSGCG